MDLKTAAQRLLKSLGQSFRYPDEIENAMEDVRLALAPAPAATRAGEDCKLCSGTGVDGDVGNDGRVRDVECACQKQSVQWDGKYRENCPDGLRCSQGCHTSEPCYYARSAQPPQAPPAAPSAEQGEDKTERACALAQAFSRGHDAGWASAKADSATTQPAALVGWVLVPVEPTPEMIAAWPNGRHGSGHEAASYRSMIAAAPKTGGANG